MVATTVVVLLARDDHFACLWAGDSRAYLLRGHALTRITRDHSLVQALVESGTISEAEAAHHPQANVITRAVGADSDLLELEKRTGQLQAGDRLLLCSDGLCKTLPEEQLAELLSGDDDTAAERLVTAALMAQVTDNVTVVTIDFDAGEETVSMEARERARLPRPCRRPRSIPRKPSRVPPDDRRPSADHQPIRTVGQPMTTAPPWAHMLPS